MFVPGQVIFFPVARGRGTVRVRRQFVKFRCTLVRVVWHCVSHPLSRLQLGVHSISQTVQLRTLPDSPRLNPGASGGWPRCKRAVNLFRKYNPSGSHHRHSIEINTNAEGAPPSVFEGGVFDFPCTVPDEWPGKIPKGEEMQLGPCHK